MFNVKAVCVVKSEKLENNINGTILFTQRANGGDVHANIELEGVSAGKHGISIYEFGNLTSGAESAGCHYNPRKCQHGGPDDSEKHAGDLGNVEANEEGHVAASLTFTGISLVGPQSVIGRTFVVHANEDDLGKGSDDLSKTTGNAGDRLAYGVIGIAK